MLADDTHHLTRHGQLQTRSACGLPGKTQAPDQSFARGSSASMKTAGRGHRARLACPSVSVILPTIVPKFARRRLGRRTQVVLRFEQRGEHAGRRRTGGRLDAGHRLGRVGAEAVSEQEEPPAGKLGAEPSLACVGALAGGACNANYPAR